MSRFTDPELQAIKEAVLAAPGTGLGLLEQEFGQSRLRLAEACMLADAVNAGRAVLTFSGGQTFGVDLTQANQAAEAAGSRVRVTEIDPGR